MAGPIDIYYLLRLIEPPAGCSPYLLLKLTQAEFANWSQSQEDAVAADVMQRRDQHIASFLSETATTESGCAPTAEIVGEFQGYPTGGAFYEPVDLPTLDIWVSPTRFGPYWIVFGTAASEEVLTKPPIAPGFQGVSGVLSAPRR